ncbi:MAG TPA: glycosyltransferase [Flavobacterium sp.]|nr:glycosyltransferase [Flavobacterium sp.]
MKKILYILDTFETGGAEKSLLDIAIQNKAAVSYFITIYKGNQLAELAKKNGIQVFQLNNTEKYGFSKAVQQIIPLIKEIQPDIIHSTLFRADIIARRLKKHFSMPLISSLVNNSYISERYEKLSVLGKLKLYGIQKYDAFTAKQVDLFISNSQTIKESNAKHLHLHPDKIKVIFRGRDFNKFQNIEQNRISQLKKELGLTEEDQVLVNVSRLLERKGQLDFLAAFKELVPKNPQLKVVIAGEGGYRKTLENAIAAYQLQDKVQLLGNRNDIPVLLSLAAVFVFPTHYEGLPGALIEAMMAKKIIVCSDIAENKECVTNEEAVFFKKGDVADLENKLELVLSNLADYNKLAQNAQKVAFDTFSIESIVNQYNLTYESLMHTN